MTRFERALRILEDEFDAFIVIGSIYNPAEGQTHFTRLNRGNSFAIDGMMNEVVNSHFCVDATVGDELDDDDE